jgi:amidophosphoribosyltransferase
MCGFVGFIGKSEISNAVKQALQAIQHRGQDSAGIGVVTENGFSHHKALGYSTVALEEFKYNGPGIAIGHVRYPTIGGGRREDAQPFFSRQPGVIMAHNGNIINFIELKNRLKKHSINLSSNCDVEPLLYTFCEHMMDIKEEGHTIEDAVKALKATYKDVKGAFAIVVGMILDGKPTLFCAKDPYGIRPAVWGKLNGTYMCASESVCIDAIDAELVGDIKPGEVMFFREGEEPKSYLIEKAEFAPCVFENIYFARSDSISNNRSVYDTRIELGRALGKEILTKKLDIDVVTPVPDTSIPAALAIAETIKKPFREGLIKNRYSARTFIMPDQTTREHALRLKLNPIRSQLEGKKVLLVDDSIVRGTTLRRIVKLLRDKGNVKEIHLAIHCPPVLNPCFYGIDISVQEDLVAHVKSLNLGFGTRSILTLEEQRALEEKVAEHLGADSLTYLSISGLNHIFKDGRCAACFDGIYPLKIDAKYADDVRNDRLKRSCKPVCEPINK